MEARRALSKSYVAPWLFIASWQGVDIVEWGLSGRRPSPPLRVGYWPEEAWWVLDKYLLLV